MYLGGNEDIFTADDVRFTPECLTNCSLCVVDLSSVEMTISDVNGGLNHPNHGLVIWLKQSTISSDRIVQMEVGVEIVCRWRSREEVGSKFVSTRG